MRTPVLCFCHGRRQEPHVSLSRSWRGVAEELLCDALVLERTFEWKKENSFLDFADAQFLPPAKLRSPPPTVGWFQVLLRGCARQGSGTFLEFWSPGSVSSSAAAWSNSGELLQLRR